MMVRFASMAACLALAAPMTLFAQTDAEEDGEVDLNSIDALLGDQVVTGDEDVDDDAAAEDAAIADSDDEAVDEDSDDDAAGDEATEGEEVPEPSDLTLAFNAYSLCALEAGTALEESGFALDVIGEEALLRCSGQRAGYVNAFYFSLLPRYPDAPEADVRASAERLVAQTDTAISAMVMGEVTDLREIREADAAIAAEADTGEAESVDDDNPDGEIAPEGEEETDPDA